MLFAHPKAGNPEIVRSQEDLRSGTGRTDGSNCLELAELEMVNRGAPWELTSIENVQKLGRGG